MKDSALVLLGMATQASITALLTQFNIIHPEPLQQALAAVMFLIIALLQMRR